MKSYISIVILIILLAGPLYSYGQKEAPTNVQIRPLTFIVRNGGYIKEIASRIHVPVGEILKANNIRSKKFLAYPGLKLIIPVPIQPRTWDPSREGHTGRSPSKEDRHESQEFEIAIDTSNFLLEEDFINFTSAQEDSIEFENINKHIRKIDKRIQTLYFKIDSMKQVDFKFEDESAPDPTHITDNIKMSRDKYYSESPLGRQADSLKSVKVWLWQRRTVLRNQITDYENLVENAAYSQHTYRHQQDVDRGFGDNLVYESKYLISKDPSMANIKNRFLSSAASEDPAVASKADKDLVERNEPAISRTSRENVVVHLKFDYAPLTMQTRMPEIKSTNAYPHGLKLLTGRTVEPPADNPPPKKEVLEQTRDIRSDDKHTGTFITSPAQRSAIVTPETQTNNILEKEKPVNTNPAISHAPDSIQTARTKPVPKGAANESAKKPKYLEPVDSVTRIKGQFYIILAREALEIGDFKGADKNLTKSLDLNPNNAEAWMLHADIYLTQGATEQSLKEYIIAGEIDSLNPKVFYNIALIYAKNNSQKAIANFTKALRANDKYILAYMGRATLYMDGKEYEKAAADYTKVLAIDKLNSAALKGRGGARMELRKYAEAIADFDSYLQIEKPDGFVLFQRGLCKIYSNELLKGCLDLSSSKDLGFKEAEKAIKKYCQ